MNRTSDSNAGEKRRGRRGPDGGGRLDAVASLLPLRSRTGDIGSGHGILPRRLLASGRASFCIATERAGAAAVSRLGFRTGHPLSPRLVVRVGDGLAPLAPDDRLDSLVLAGMGARTMLRILGRDPRGILSGVRLVLQPQSEPARLRGWLLQVGWRIVAETVGAERGRLYEVIAAERGPAFPPLAGLTLDDLLEVGPCLVRSGNRLVRERWERTLRVRLAAAQSIPPESPDRRSARLAVAQARRILRAFDDASA